MLEKGKRNKNGTNNIGIQAIVDSLTFVMRHVGTEQHASFTFVIDHGMFRDVAHRLVPGEFILPHIKSRRACRTVLGTDETGKPRRYPVVRGPLRFADRVAFQ